MSVEHTSQAGRFLAIYGHVNVSVAVGQAVGAGQQVGTLASVSPVHLHLGIYPLAAGVDGGSIVPKGRRNCSSESNPGYVDPIPWLAARTPGSSAGRIRGSFDEGSSPTPGQLRVRGWAFDEDAPTASIRIHVYIGGQAGDPAAQGYDIGPADVHRPDVGSAFPGVGNFHGYDKTLDVAKFGNQSVYVYAINAPGTPGDNVLIDSRTVHVPQPNPFGSLDGVASPRPGWLRVSGWAADPSGPGTSLAVHVYGGTKYLDSINADQSRPDVGAAFPGYGNLHGYDSTLAVPPGTYAVCTYGINIGVGTSNTQLGCKTVTVAADVTAPETTITAQPPTNGTATAVAVAFTADEPGATFTCQWDAAAWVPCTSPATHELPVGPHSFGVRATDSAGNTDPSPATTTFLIAAPSPALPNPPAPAGLSLTVQAVKNRSKLHIDIGPDSTERDYKIRVQRRIDNAWRTIQKTYTRGPADQRRVDLPRGRYRVVVPTQFGFDKRISRKVRLRR